MGKKQVVPDCVHCTHEAYDFGEEGYIAFY